MKLARYYAAWLIVMLIVGCQQMGVPTPETFNQKAAVAYGTVTQVRTTALTLLKAKKISTDDAQNINNQADNARAALDIARTTSATDMTAANAKLIAATVALQALQTYLSTRN